MLLWAKACAPQWEVAIAPSAIYLVTVTARRPVSVVIPASRRPAAGGAAGRRLFGVLVLSGWGFIPTAMGVVVAC